MNEVWKRAGDVAQRILDKSGGQRGDERLEALQGITVPDPASGCNSGRRDLILSQPLRGWRAQVRALSSARASR